MDAKQVRSAFANLALAVFVVSTTIGGFMWKDWAGFVALGLTSGISAIFLGADDE
jgi:hypothetical protein